MMDTLLRNRSNLIHVYEVLIRMRSSAANAFCHAQMASVQVTSTLWNLAHRRFFASVTAGVDWFIREFWRAVTRSYASITFRQGFPEEQMGKGSSV